MVKDFILKVNSVRFSGFLVLRFEFKVVVFFLSFLWGDFFFGWECLVGF